MRSQFGSQNGCPGCAGAIDPAEVFSQLASNGFGYLALSAMAAADTPLLERQAALRPRQRT